jgi:phosphoglucosamine mutase
MSMRISPRTEWILPKAAAVEPCLRDASRPASPAEDAPADNSREASQAVTAPPTVAPDRYVVEQMRAKGYNVGGEQSGHIILSNFSTTGDGLLAALQVLAVIVQSGKPASEVCKLFDPAPQVLENVRYERGKPDPMEAVAVKAAIKDAEVRLKGNGRLLVRKSGTEPLVRIMAEGDDETIVRSAVNDVKAAVVAAAKAA